MEAQVQRPSHVELNRHMMEEKIFCNFLPSDYQQRIYRKAQVPFICGRRRFLIRSRASLFLSVFF